MPEWGAWAKRTLSRVSHVSSVRQSIAHHPMRLVVGVVIAVLLVQVVAALAIGLVARSGARDIASDAAVFAGEATALHVRETRSAAVDSLQELERFVTVDGLTFDDAGTIEDQMIRLVRRDVDLSGVGLANDRGDAITAKRDAEGLTTVVMSADGSAVAHHYDFDGVFRSVGLEPPPVQGALLPWVEQGLAAGGVRWHEPYVPMQGPRTAVNTTVSGMANGEPYVALVITQAPELDRAVWESPGSNVGDVWLVSGGGAILSAPPDKRQWLADFVKEHHRLPTMEDASLTSPSSARKEGLGLVGNAGSLISYERPVWGEIVDPQAPILPGGSGDPQADADVAAGLGADWTVYVEVEVAAAAPSAAIIQRTLGAYTVLIAGLVAVSGLLLWRLRGPLSSLVRRSRTDALTGLANRHYFSTRALSMLDSAERREARVLVLVLDLDHFKLINDILGHDAGDDALVSVGRALRDAAGPRDVTARLGGDEFGMLRWLEDGEDPANIAEQVRAAVHEAIAAHAAPDSPVGASAGFAVASPGYYRLARLLTAADDALVGGRTSGKGTVYAADPARR